MSKELRSIIQAFREARERGERCALATVVRVSGSAYRRPGARMLITESGRTVGSVSGGCLETDLLRKARQALLRGAAALVTYDTTDDDEQESGVGLGCRGIIDLLIEPLPAQGPCYVDVIQGWLTHRRAGVLATLLSAQGRVDVEIGAHGWFDEYRDGSGELLGSSIAERLRDKAPELLTTGRSGTVIYRSDEANIELFLERIAPPLPLVLLGAGRDAVPLVGLAQELGWHVTVADSRPGYAVRRRFPTADVVLCCQPAELPHHVPLDEETAVVLMSHNYGLDRQLLEILLPAPVRYLGLLGPRDRAERLLAELAESGFRPTAEQLQSFYAPVGLDIGAETSEEIALAILAEIRAASGKRAGGFLRDRPAPIHPRGEGELMPSVVQKVVQAAGATVRDQRCRVLRQ